VAGAEAVVDVDHRHTGSAAIQHAEQRGQTVEAGAVAGAGGHRDHAVGQLPFAPGHLLLDYIYVRECPYTYDTIVKGDSRSYSIAAASNVAKVTRDRLMVEAEATYPGYNFARHKGYPTKAHFQRLNELGPCPIHRRSFAPVAQASMFFTGDD